LSTGYTYDLAGNVKTGDGYPIGHAMTSVEGLAHSLWRRIGSILAKV
jgi:hypothetical protein